jgi:gamma-glutamyltranspeptidase/glutathione hydrolase
MAPTIVLRDGKVLLALGSPGGSRIITITLETLMNVLDYDMEPQQAVDAARIHSQWLPDIVFVEPFALSPDTQKLLAQMGYKLTEQRPWGATELAAMGPSRATPTAVTSGNDSTLTRPMRPGLLYGAHDDRRPAGAAIGE